MPHFAASQLGLFCLPMSHEKGCQTSVGKSLNVSEGGYFTKALLVYSRGKKRLEKNLETAKNDMTSLQEKLLNLQTGTVLNWITRYGHSQLSEIGHKNVHLHKFYGTS